MIAYLNPLQGVEFSKLACVEPLVGARIHSWFRCYGNAYPFCDLWILYADAPAAVAGLQPRGGLYPQGIMARYQGTLCLACSMQVDWEELADFVEQSGAVELECTEPIMRQLLPRMQFRLRERQTMMTLPEEKARQFVAKMQPQLEQAQFACNGKYREIYRILSASFPQFEHYNEFTHWYVDMFARVKKAGSFLCALQQNGREVATAGVYNLSSQAGVIGSVATMPEYRQQGYATLCVARCVQQLLEQRIPIYLVAARPELEQYYARMGFEACGIRCSAMQNE